LDETASPRKKGQRETSKNFAGLAGLWSDRPDLRGGEQMRGQSGFFDVDERLKELSAKGDSLERLNAMVDFQLFRLDLERAVPRSDRSKGGCPPFDHCADVQGAHSTGQPQPVGRAH
jgi:hypothetical protein